MVPVKVKTRIAVGPPALLTALKRHDKIEVNFNQRGRQMKQRLNLIALKSDQEELERKEQRMIRSGEGSCDCKCNYPGVSGIGLAILYLGDRDSIQGPPDIVLYCKCSGVFNYFGLGE